ncbi:teratocarcinoma-derived growth factor 1 isoform X2 [Phycodurus eques]|uniref:teratocarcinoma-derived growth factor 1 isoform X2 n=1 Tax=Phycodurus eques TaxID=693459 RepID=UPI002ACE3398|nr:teratocarcinoma-derived growth factor 1 isoform X2 [Phycodurus eques]
MKVTWGGVGAGSTPTRQLANSRRPCGSATSFRPRTTEKRFSFGDNLIAGCTFAGPSHWNWLDSVSFGEHLYICQFFLSLLSLRLFIFAIVPFSSIFVFRLQDEHATAQDCIFVSALSPSLRCHPRIRKPVARSRQPFPCNASCGLYDDAEMQSQWSFGVDELFHPSMRVGRAGFQMCQTGEEQIWASLGTICKRKPYWRFGDIVFDFLFLGRVGDERAKGQTSPPPPVSPAEVKSRRASEGSPDRFARSRSPNDGDRKHRDANAVVPFIGLTDTAEQSRSCCKNGGTCILGSFCACPPFFIGRSCEYNQRIRHCGLIPHGEWVRKGCSYCRCGYGFLHCFPRVFHKDCEDLH